jgi:hypothetical protein
MQGACISVSVYLTGHTDFVYRSFHIDWNGELTTLLYDWRDDFDFAIVGFPFLCGKVLVVCVSYSWFGAQSERVLREGIFRGEADGLQVSWCCGIVVGLVWGRHFANSMVAVVTLFAIASYHWPMCWMVCFVRFVRLSFPCWLWRRVIPYT